MFNKNYLDQQKVISVENKQRTINNYDDHVIYLKENLGLNNYMGVKSESVLNSLKYFHVA